MERTISFFCTTIYQPLSCMILTYPPTLLESTTRQVSKTIIAEYTRANLRRSPRNPSVVSYVQTRPYRRSAAAAKAPAKRDPKKKTPAKKAPAKKTRANNTKKRKSEGSPDSEDGSDEPTPKKPRIEEKSPTKANKQSPAVEDDEESDTCSGIKAPAKMAAVKKSPRKKVKEQSPSDEEDEKNDNDDGVPAGTGRIDSGGYKLEPSDDEEPVDYNIHINPSHNRRILKIYVRSSSAPDYISYTGFWLMGSLLRVCIMAINSFLHRLVSSIFCKSCLCIVLTLTSLRFGRCGWV